MSSTPVPRPKPQSLRDFWDQRIGRNPNEIGVGCANVGLAYNRWLYRLRGHRFDQLIAGLEIDPRRMRVLDIGSGTGFYINKWQQSGAGTVEGLDFSPTAIELLRHRYPDTVFHLADIREQLPPTPSGPYDVISAFDVLFHLVDDEHYLAALKNMARMLKPDGCLLLSENFVHRERPRGGDYHYSRTLNQIESLLQQAGFRLESRRPMFVLMNAPDDARGWLAPAWWRLVRFALRQGEWVAWLAGACLYPLERLLTTLKRESPSTEIAVCRLVGRESGQ